MEFETESEFKKVAMETLQREFVDETSVTLEEFPYANGRADLVIAKSSEAYLSKRTKDLGISEAITTDRHLQVFLQLHGRGSITKEHFYSIGAIDKNKKQSALSWLIDAGFVREQDNGKIRTAPYLRRHITSSYSIELKLGKWKKALEQAVRGKAFSHCQLVAMPEDNVLRALEHLDTFKEKEVGLMEISSDGSYYVYHHPEREQPFSAMNKWRLNEKTIKENIPL